MQVSRILRRSISRLRECARQREAADPGGRLALR
jgi:hypothetical protein